MELALRENLRAQRLDFLAATCYSGAFPTLGARLLVQRADAVKLAFVEQRATTGSGREMFVPLPGHRTNASVGCPGRGLWGLRARFRWWRFAPPPANFQRPCRGNGIELSAAP